MGTQWIHVDLYGKTASKLKKPTDKEGNAEKAFSASEIAAEQMRVEENSTHVVHPLPPSILFGIDPRLAVEAALLSFEGEPKVVVNTKKGPRERGMRSDTPIVLAGVCSWPDSVEVMGSDEDRADLYKRWVAENLKYLRSKYGSDLRSVVQHVDEAHPHLHFTVVCNRAIETKKYHPGVSADSRTNAKKALTAFQDEYYREVAVKCALGRLGPRRQRLKGGEYKKQKAEREAFVRELQRLEKRMALVEQMEQAAGTIMADAMASAGQILIDALASAKRQTTEMLNAAKAEADKMLERAKKVLNDLRSKDAEIEKTLGELKQYADPKVTLNAERLVGQKSAIRREIKEGLQTRRGAVGSHLLPGLEEVDKKATKLD